MRKKIAFLLLLLCTAGVLYAQETKSVKPLAGPARSTPAHNPLATLAVVVGISDYQDASITDLHYAHRDAEIFADYLKSKAGGQLGEQQIQLLTNQQATIAGIQSALEWLLKNTRPNGQAILFFSGHGDVETKNDKEKGYLLTYDTPKNNYRLNALDLQYLNEHVIGGLSQRGIKVIVVTDACHAGALAGETTGGREATASELMKRFAGEVRIMSCQPYELSLEGARWGGGRGVFSYYLVDGLKGQADDDGDQRVDLFELEFFLQDHVRTATGKTQHPDIFGGRKEESLFAVDEAAVAEWKKTQRLEIQQDFEKEILESLADREGYARYEEFTAALHGGDLLAAAGHYYALYADTAFTPLRSILDERLSRALLDSAQQALIAYLATDPVELADRDLFDQKYDRFARYLAKAAEVLGPKDPRYRQTLAKQYYFEGLVLRLAAEQRGGNDSLYRLALEKQNQALGQEDRAAYIYNELGFLHLQLGEPEQGRALLQKAVALSPTWAISQNNLAIAYKQADSLTQAKAHFFKAIELKPDFASAYANLGNLYDALGQADSAEMMYREAIVRYPSDKDNFYNLGVLLSDQEGRTADARAAYRQALRLDAGYPPAWLGLGLLYANEGQTDSAEIWLLGAIERKPDYTEAYEHLVVFYQNQWEKATALLRAAPLEALEKMQVLWSAGFALFRSEAYDSALNAFRLAVETNPDEPAGYYVLCTFHAARGQEREALDNLEKTLRKAGDNVGEFYESIRTDSDLDALRTSKRFKDLMRRYFPGRQ